VLLSRARDAQAEAVNFLAMKLFFSRTFEIRLLTFILWSSSDYHLNYEPSYRELDRTMAALVGRGVSGISFFFQGTDFKCSKLDDGGRGIRRLACLSKHVEDLIAKFDRRILLGVSDESEPDGMDSADPL